MLICKMLLKQMSSIINQNVENFIILINILYLLFFLRDMYEGNLSLKDADDEQSKFIAKLKNLDKGRKRNWKNSFLK